MHPDPKRPPAPGDPVPGRASAPNAAGELHAGVDGPPETQRDDSSLPGGDLILDSGPEKIRTWMAPGGGDMMGAGMQFAGALLVFTLGGNWLDGKFGTKPWLLLTGIALGLVGGFISLLKQAQAASRG